MKKIILLFSISFAWFNLLGQNAFYDAQYLNQISITDIENIEVATKFRFKDSSHNIVIPDIIEFYTPIDTILITGYKWNNELNAFIDDSEEPKSLILNEVIMMVSVAGSTRIVYPIAPGLVLTEEEANQLNNLSKFIRDTFDSTIVKLDLSIIKNIIDKYNNHIESLRAEQASNNYVAGFLNQFGFGSALTLIPNLVSGKSSISDTSQSNIIDGIAKYYAGEFKKARTITYMKAFEATAGKIGELQILFPNAYEKLERADPSKFPDLGNEYKKIFYEDLKNAWPNLLDYIEKYPEDSIADHKLKVLKARNLSRIRASEVYFPILLSTDILKRLSENLHPVDILNFVDTKYYDDAYLSGSLDTKKRIALTLHGINLLQSNLRDTTKTTNDKFSNVWVSLEQLKQLNTKNEIKYFFGLLFQQDQEFIKKLFPSGTLSNAAEQQKFLNNKIYPILSHLKTIQEVGKTLDDKGAGEKFLKYLEVNMDLLTETQLIDNQDFSKYFKAAKKIILVYQNIRSSDFSNTTYYLVGLLKEVLGDDAAFTATLFKIEEYGGFMSEIINAENSDEIKETITKFAAPPSSYLLKRTYKNTLSITGHPGYFVAHESIDSEKGFVTGLTLPMGVEFTFKPKSDLKKTRGSIGFFAQIIDLGAVLNYRLDDSTSELPEQITFEQILSPGFSITYGFKNSPLTLGLGFQRTPELRKVTIDATEDFETGDRLFLRVAWDIPFINIAKSKSR